MKKIAASEQDKCWSINDLSEKQFRCRWDSAVELFSLKRWWTLSRREELGVFIYSCTIMSVVAASTMDHPDTILFWTIDHGLWTECSRSGRNAHWPLKRGNTRQKIDCRFDLDHMPSFVKSIDWELSLPWAVGFNANSHLGRLTHGKWVCSGSLSIAISWFFCSNIYFRSATENWHPHSPFSLPLYMTHLEDNWNVPRRHQCLAIRVYQRYCGQSSSDGSHVGACTST